MRMLPLVLLLALLLLLQAPVQHSLRLSPSRLSAAATGRLHWSPDSWRSMPIMQAPVYPNEEIVRNVMQTLHDSPAVVSISEIMELKQQLALATTGNALLLMGGDCAESFAEFSESTVLSTASTLLQMSSILSEASTRPVVTIGRIAGQFAKPRSESVEQIDGTSLPSYRGDIINSIEFTASARMHDPKRMLQAYRQSVHTMELLRSLRQTPQKPPQGLGDRISTLHEALTTASTAAELPSAVENPSNRVVYSSHECLLLPYEQALTRCENGQYYDTSAHMLWIGERTRQLDHAHMHFASGLSNPIGIKLSEKISPSQLLETVDLLNPANEAGKIVLIVRMGAHHLPSSLPALVEAMQCHGKAVVWACDPMHANTFRSPQGLKTRSFSALVQEAKTFAHLLHQHTGRLSGLHLEMTGQAVTECVGGISQAVDVAQLAENYRSACDPRLNRVQALDLAHELAHTLHQLVQPAVRQTDTSGLSPPVPTIEIERDRER